MRLLLFQLVCKLDHSNAASQTFTEGHKPKVSGL